MRILYLMCFLVGITSSSVLAQRADSVRAVHYTVELGGLAVSSQQTPYWLRTNQYGTMPLQGSLGTLRVGMLRDYKPRTDSATKRKKRFDWGFGLYAVANVGPRSSADNPAVLLPDAYVKF